VKLPLPRHRQRRRPVRQSPSRSSRSRSLTTNRSWC